MTTSRIQIYTEFVCIFIASSSEVHTHREQLFDISTLFTIQFLPIGKRKDLIKKVYDGLNKGGAFIFCEKFYLEIGKIQEIFTFSHYDEKLKSFSSEEILGKQMILREIMKPLTRKENEELLESAGFRFVETFFQSLNFCGWICIK